MHTYVRIQKQGGGVFFPIFCQRSSAVHFDQNFLQFHISNIAFFIAGTQGSEGRPQLDMLIDKRKDIHKHEQTERQKEGKLDHYIFQTDRLTDRQKKPEKHNTDSQTNKITDKQIYKG